MADSTQATATAEPTITPVRIILVGNPNGLMVRRDMSDRKVRAKSLLPAYKYRWHGNKPEGMDDSDWDDRKADSRARQEGAALDMLFKILDSGDPVIVYVERGCMDPLPNGVFPRFMRAPYADLLDYVEGDTNVTVVTLGSNPRDVTQEPPF